MEVQVTCHGCGEKFTVESEVVQYKPKVILIVGSTKARQVTCPHCGASNMVSVPEGMIKTDPGTITRLEP